MAESDVLKKEDVDDITDALQVAPHQKNNQFSAVSKSEEGDLVSLDELYEKTGQEAINTFIHGFEELARTGRLSREHGLALNVAGAEDWFPFPDVYNARIGQEGFVSALKKGAVAIVKAIIAFIKGVANWVYTRIKALLGFSRTVNEAKFIHERSQVYHDLVGSTLDAFGLSVFDKEEFIKTLTNDLTTKEIFQLTKNRLDDNKTAFDKLQEAQLFLVDHATIINKWNKNIQQAKRGSDAIIQNLRRLLAKKSAIYGLDFTENELQYVAIIRDYLNPEKPTEYLTQLINLLYGIEINGLGVETKFNEVRETLKRQVEIIKGAYDPAVVAGVDETLRYLYKIRFSQSVSNTRIDPSIVDTLKKSVNDGDIEVINAIDNNVPNSNISNAYVQYAKAVSTYTDAIDLILTLVQRTEKIIHDMLIWQARINELSAAVLGRGLMEFEAIAKTLPDESKDKLKQLSPILFHSLEQSYIKNTMNKDGMPDFYSWLSNRLASHFKTQEGRQLLKVAEKHKARLLG